MKDFFYILIIVILVSSCVSEDFFGLSDSAEIKDIQVSNQAGKAIINSKEQYIILEMPPGVNISEVEINLLELSSFAKADKTVGDTLDLGQANSIEITAESGQLKTWTVLARITTAEPQLENGDFNSWHLTGAGYYEPGSSAESTIWCTGNPGTKILGLFATTPFELADNDYAVRMETLDNGRLSATFGAPVSAGSIVTGIFDPDRLDPSDPEAAITFGTLFSGRPQSFSLQYSYVPGATNKDKNGNVLDYGDECDVYALLEVREGTAVKRLATAWFRSKELKDGLTNLDVDFVYGELGDTYPEYMKPDSGLYVSGDSIGFILPTHIIFVASSSFDGANFAGAVGSTLLIDNLVLNY